MGNTNTTLPPTETQLLGLQVCRTLAAIPSVIGAAYIFQHVARSPKRRKRAAKQIMMIMSLMDLILSCIAACSSSVAPKEVSGFLTFASGTWATCEAAAFISVGCVISSALYNASLTHYYLLTVRYGWTDAQVKNISVLLLTLPQVVGWTTAIVGFLLNVYNPVYAGCDVESYPMQCWRNNFPCERGGRANVTFMVALMYFWLWAVFVFLVVAMILIYLKLSSVSSLRYPLPDGIERSSSSRIRSRQNGDQGSSLSGSRSSSREGKLYRLKRQFATQALLYCMAYAMTWIFLTILRILVGSGEIRGSVPLIFLATILGTLQGFWNAFIYVRPRYLRYRNQQAREQQLQQPQAEPPDAISAFISALSLKAEDEEDDYESLSS